MKASSLANIKKKNTGMFQYLGKLHAAEHPENYSWRCTFFNKNAYKLVF